jgi:CheY-like chemotaxis protein
MSHIKSCLLVENDPEDQQYFIDVLHCIPGDIACYAVSTAEEALYVLREENFRPDYIFTELNLPGTSGFDLLKELRTSETLRGIPIVVYTSDYSEIQIEKAKKAGASLMFSKTRLPELPAFLKRVFQAETVL